MTHPDISAKRNIPLGMMLQSLGGSSIVAQQLLNQLRHCSEEEETPLLEQFWSVQGKLEEHVDAHADLATQIEAELTGLKAIKAFYDELYQREIDRLERWRQRLDEMILSLNKRGLLPNEATGIARSIRITYNPPSCEIVDQTLVPAQYTIVKQSVTPDKALIKQAWSKGQVVPGTRVHRKPNVRYAIAPQTTTAMREAASAAKSPDVQPVSDKPRKSKSRKSN